MNVFIIVTDVGVPRPSRLGLPPSAVDVSFFIVFMGDLIVGLAPPIVRLRPGLLPFWVRVGDGLSP